jgi:hypothetical protein
MNERIKELAKQATQQYSPTYYTQEWIQKFAELIIKDCAYWMENERDEQGDRIGDSFYWAGKMRKHFGVEE